ncbi:MAG TPA: DUF4388 domain-containing protein [Candidatus Saccharimonadales bacterium]|nr:DUF4388 domain-containing protein [Candidatus Saccharimonadales bacterium]
MTLRGEIEAFPLETVVQMIHSTNKTGQLEVRGADAQGGSLGFDGGRLVAAVAGEDVGEPALGAVFAVESGSFEFIPWGDAPGANLSGDLNQLLDKAVEERDRLVAIRKIIPDDRSRFRLSERAADKGTITLSSDQWRTLLAVNGERDVPSVAEHLKAGKTATRASLATLVDAGFIDVLEPAAEAPAPAAPAQAPASEQWSPPAPVQEWVAPTPEAQPEVSWAPPTPEPQAEPARPSWEQHTPPPQTWEQQRSIGPSWEPPAPTPAPSSWDQPAAMPQWGAPEADLREDLAAALDERMSTALPEEPAVETEVAPEPSPIDIPPVSDERLSALSGVFGSAPVAPEMVPPEPPPAPPPARDHIGEWSRPAPQAEAEPVPEEKKKGLFGFLKRDEPSHDGPAVAHAAATEAAPAEGRAGQLASLANALLGEYNSGQYGKGRLDDRMANLLMRVDEQADPIDRPLPIVDDRIDSQALDRENVPESQALPYLAILVSQIYEDAEHTFGKDKAKRGYKAAQQQVFGSDASALSAPDVAGRLPRV